MGLNETFRSYPLLEDPLNSKVKLKVDGIKSSNITKVINKNATSKTSNEKHVRSSKHKDLMKKTQTVQTHQAEFMKKN